MERLETRAALVEEEAGRAGQLEEEATERSEQLRALQDKARALEFCILQTRGSSRERVNHTEITPSWTT